MNANSVLNRLVSLGVTATVDGEALELSPGSKVPEDLVPEVRAHKPEIVERLRQRETTLGYRQEFPDEQLGDSELAEVMRRVEEEGVCLVWAEALEDFVAFYDSAADRENIPPGFVPYSEAELLKLFAPGQEDIPTNTLRLIHATKKKGARITDVEPETS